MSLLNTTTCVLWPLLFEAVNHRRVTAVSDAQYGTFAVV
jgi:hypothetical protein